MGVGKVEGEVPHSIPTLSAPPALAPEASPNGGREELGRLMLLGWEYMRTRTLTIHRRQGNGRDGDRLGDWYRSRRRGETGCGEAVGQLSVAVGIRVKGGEKGREGGEG